MRTSALAPVSFGWWVDTQGFNFFPIWMCADGRNYWEGFLQGSIRQGTGNTQYRWLLGLFLFSYVP